MARSNYLVQGLLVKMKNPDADYRFMALNDLMAECMRTGSTDGFSVDEATEKSTVDLVLELVNDKNTEVKNQSVKTLGVLVKRVTDPRMTTIIDKLTSYAGSKDDQLRDLAGLALKTVIVEIAPSSKLAPTLVAKLTPKLVAQLQGTDASPDSILAALDAVSDLLTKFPSHFRASGQLQAASLGGITPLLAHTRPAVSKRAVIALGCVAGAGGEEVFNAMMNKIIVPNLKSGSGDGTRVSVLLVSALAKTSAERLQRRVAEILPAILIAAEVDKNSTGDDEQELREAALHCLEMLVVKCPAETASHVPAITKVATSAISFDPNYAGDVDDDDEEMGDDQDDNADDDDDDFADEYSDDDDVSWKIRRAATKLFGTLISTRTELLADYYKTIAPVLLSRFSEREESVKIEVWSTYTLLLKQTKVFTEASGPSVRADSGLKRKRASTTGSATGVGAEGPIGSLNAQASAVAKAVLKDLGSKSVQIKLAGIVLLHSLVDVLHGGLGSSVPLLVSRIEAALKSSDPGVSGTAPNLKIEVYSFFALFFANHHPKTFNTELSRLVALLITGTSDPFHRIASEAFVAASALVRVLPSLSRSSPTASEAPSALTATMTIYEATIKRLNSATADQEVKEKAITCLGDLLTFAGEQLDTQLDEALPLLTARLENESSRFPTVKVVAQVAKQSSAKSSSLEAWAQSILPVVSGFVWQNNKPLKMESFVALEALLSRCGTHLQPESANAVVMSLRPLITVDDLQVLPLAINSLALVLELSPFFNAEEQKHVVEPVLSIIKSPLVQGPALDALIALFGAVTKSGADPSSTIQALIQVVSTSHNIESTKGVTGSGLQPYYTAARCIGAVVLAAPSHGASAVGNFAEPLQTASVPTSKLFFSLLCLGEIGRIVNLADESKIVEKVAALFRASSDDIRNAAAFALGNIAAGNPEKLLGTLVARIDTQQNQDEKDRYLALQSLKEAIVHTTPSALSHYGDTLWKPLFDNCEAQGEAAKNVAAECLGKLTLSDPAKYLAQIQTQLHSSSSKTRATCMAAIRFTLTDDSTGFDDQLAPYLTQFLSHVSDEDLAVRALALSALNSAAHNKPSLLRDSLSTVMPQLYKETVLNADLVRIVQMGPFKHRVDDGLETRKLAYLTLLTLMDTCLSRIDVNECLSRVILGISDEDEIKVLCYLMLTRLSHVAPTIVAARLDQAAEPLSKTLAHKLKDDAVKQDVERNEELRRSALRCVASLNRLSNASTTPKFSQLLRDASVHGVFASEFKALLVAESLASTGGATAMEVD